MALKWQDKRKDLVSAEWLSGYSAYDQHGLGLKPSRAILLCPWERHFTALLSCLVTLASSCVTSLLNFKRTANILASPKAGRSNCPFISASVAFLRVRRLVYRGKVNK